MSGLDQKKPTYAPAYMVGIYPALAERARSMGYALALHGSLQRDLDLIAVPWADEAAEPADLLAALCAEFDIDTNNPHGAPERRSHGRLCWSIPLWWGAYIDLSVIPKAAPEPATVAVDAGALAELREAMTKFRMLPESAVSRPAGSVARERVMEAARRLLKGGNQ